MFPNPEVREVTIFDYVKILQKRIIVIIVFLVVIPVSSIIVVSNTTPQYLATASIIIYKGSPASSITKIDEGFSYRDVDYYSSQHEILRSRTLAEQVYDVLKLEKDVDYHSLGDPIGKLRGQVRIDPVKNSQIVLIQVEDTDALRAASIANAFAREYIKQDTESKSKIIKQALGWLVNQVDEMKKKVSESENTLNSYLNQYKIVTATDVQEYSGRLKELRSKASDLDTQLLLNLKRYKDKHPKIIELKTELIDVRRKIQAELENVKNLNEKMIQYNILKKEAQSNQQIYTSMLDRMKQSDLIGKTQATNIKVVDLARPPSKPYKPQKQKAITSAFIFALLGGVGFVFLLEYIDASIRTAEDVSVYLVLPFLGYIPSTGKEAISDREKSLICHVKPKSKITEAYRAVRTSIIFASPEDKPLKNILITSSLPQEGKSFFSLNISTIFANINERVILIDVDMRRPKIYKSFDMDMKPGLSNYLTGSVPLDGIIRPTAIRNLSVILSGTIPPNPSELLSSGKIRHLFDELRTRFDRIIIDSPPILSVADTSLLANIVDGVILVVKGGSTRLDAIVRSKNKIIEAKGRIVGVIVNNILPEKEDRYYYYHYYYNEEEGKKKTS